MSGRKWRPDSREPSKTSRCLAASAITDARLGLAYLEGVVCGRYSYSRVQCLRYTLYVTRHQPTTFNVYSWLKVPVSISTPTTHSIAPTPRASPSSTFSDPCVR